MRSWEEDRKFAMTVRHPGGDVREAAESPQAGGGQSIWKMSE